MAKNQELANVVHEQKEKEQRQAETLKKYLNVNSAPCVAEVCSLLNVSGMKARNIMEDVGL